MEYELTKADLEAHLRDQMSFLRRSAEAFDQGAEGEAKRLAIVLRVLLHDTGQSTSLLVLLKMKKHLRLVDTAEPINPANLLPTPGLVMMRYEGGVGGSYIPPLGELAPPRQNPLKPFEPWWTDPVTKDGAGNMFSRKDYVQTVSNKEGGAHVEHSLDAAFNDLARNNALGWVYTLRDGEVKPMEMNPAYASVRQIAYEVEETITAQFRHLVYDPPNAGG